jgi:hypothetical protein
LSVGLPQQSADSLAPAAVQLMFLGAAADPSSVSFSVPGKPGWVLLLQQATKVLLRLHTLQRLCMCITTTTQQQQQQQQEADDLKCTAPRLLRQLRLLQPPPELCQVLSACCAGMEAAWPAASAAELQLCLTGLQDFGRVISSSKCSPATVFNCLMALEAAASEYAAASAEDGASDATARSMVDRPVGIVEQVEQSSLARLLQADGVASRHPCLSMKRELVCGALQVEALRCLSWCLWLLGVDA